MNSPYMNVSVLRGVHIFHCTNYTFHIELDILLYSSRRSLYGNETNGKQILNLP